jgi:hypothetical protein
MSAAGTSWWASGHGFDEDRGAKKKSAVGILLGGRALLKRWHGAVRRTHKWIALVIGAQAVLWTLGGLYMTSVPIDIIHGDHLVGAPTAPSLPAASLADPLAVVASVPGATSVRLGSLLGRPVYIASGDEGEGLFDARTGVPLPAPDERQIRAIAERSFTGEEPLVSLRLISNVPMEIRGRKAPLWRAEFGGWNKPTFYLSPETGELLTRRHELWRVFDFVWMLHIMDYDERENVNNSVLRFFTWGAVLMALSGAWLFLYAFPKRRRKAHG